MFGRKRKERKLDFYDLEVRRIQEEMKEMETNTESYKASMNEVKDLIKLQGEAKDNKRRITREAKGQIWGNVLKGGLLLGGIGLVTYFELKGNTYTGEKRKWTDTLISSCGRWFGK